MRYHIPMANQRSKSSTFLYFSLCPKASTDGGSGRLNGGQQVGDTHEESLAGLHILSSSQKPMRPVSSLVVHAICLDSGMVEPMGTLGGCANCHSGHVESSHGF